MFIYYKYFNKKQINIKIYQVIYLKIKFLIVNLF